jgi:aryl-alcohol dehydrogenase-like predicted oxidoreductase
MEYRRLGITDIDVSVVALGCWAIGGEVGVWGPVDDNESIAAIQQGLDVGLTFIDTAPAYGYGHSEEIVGKAIAGRRDQVILGTKCGLVWREVGGRIERCLSPKSVTAECTASLHRLRVETIDLYQIHWPDPETPIRDTLEALARLREQGKIRAIGVSNFAREQLAEARKYSPIDCLQPELSMFERAAMDDLLPYCREYGIGAVIYAPLARGLLTGKFHTASRFADLRAKDPRFTGPAFTTHLTTIDRLKTFAKALDCTVAQLALRWAIQQDGVTAAIAGFKRPSQVIENARAGDLLIPPTMMDEINAILTERE